MKRIISIVSITLAALMVAALLVACGGPAGKYVVKSIDGKSVDDVIKAQAEASGVSADELLKQMNVEKAEEIVTLELKSDGSVIMDVKMLSTKMDGTWKQDGDNIAITIDDQTANFTLKGNELSGEDGEQKYIFVKK